jgi:hypothetical protein
MSIYRCATSRLWHSWGFAACLSCEAVKAMHHKKLAASVQLPGESCVSFHKVVPLMLAKKGTANITGRRQQASIVPNQQQSEAQGNERCQVVRQEELISWRQWHCLQNGGLRAPRSILKHPCFGSCITLLPHPC